MDDIHRLCRVTHSAQHSVYRIRSTNCQNGIHSTRSFQFARFAHGKCVFGFVNVRRRKKSIITFGF